MSRRTAQTYGRAADASTFRRAGVSLVIAAALTVSACTPTPAPSAVQPAATPSSSASPQATSTVDPAVAATTSAVESALKTLVAGNPKPDRETLRAALVSAGIPNANVEVSVSRTPTGLDVDAMEAAALTGDSCVMGQIRDGGVVVTVLPVLATGKCFVGDAR
ncbi:UNVERIFIED_CONTAM: ABC-type transport system substrate-binding protein [Jeotgalibacillus campisalis]